MLAGGQTLVLRERDVRYIGGSARSRDCVGAARQASKAVRNDARYRLDVCDQIVDLLKEILLTPL